MYSFPDLEPVCCSMSSSNRCFLTCIQISQEAHQVVWYSHLFQNFPRFTVIHTVKGFGIVNKAEIVCLSNFQGIGTKDLVHFNKMQVRKQQLELDMEQQTGTKKEKEHIKAYIVTLLI